VEPGPLTQYRRNRLASPSPDTECRTGEEHGKVLHGAAVSKSRRACTFRRRVFQVLSFLLLYPEDQYNTSDQ